MVTVNGIFDGKRVILDAIPADLAPHTRVRVTIEKVEELQGLGALIAKARPCDTPPDFAVQHEHYAKGTPKR